MKRFLLVIAVALGLLAASALPAIADEHVAKRSKWSHNGTKVYTTTAVNQHNKYGDLQGILKFRRRSARLPVGSTFRSTTSDCIGCCLIGPVSWW